MLRDELCHLVDTVLRAQECPQTDRPLEHLVELVDVSDLLLARPGQRTARRGPPRSFASIDGASMYLIGRVVSSVIDSMIEYLSRKPPSSWAPKIWNEPEPSLESPTGVPVKPMIVAFGNSGHQVGAEVGGHRAVRLVDEDVDVVAQRELSLPDLLELVDHRDDQAAEVRVEDVLQIVPCYRPVGPAMSFGLHLAEQTLDPLL